MADFSRLTAFLNGQPNLRLLCASAELTVYWRGSMFDRSAALEALYRRVLQRSGSTYRFFETGTMSGAKPLKADTLEALPMWLASNKRRRDVYMLSLESGAAKNMPSDSSFFFIADEDDDEPFGALRVGLPLSGLDEPARFQDLVLELLGDLDFESGHAGVGINWDPRGDDAIDAQGVMAEIASRFWTVDLFDFDVTLVSMRKTKPFALKRASWLTLLGAGMTKALGGLPALATAVANGAAVREVPTGVLIQAGPQPILGDVNRREDLSTYLAIGSLLSPFRCVDHRAIFGGSNGDPVAATRAWLSRFDGPTVR